MRLVQIFAKRGIMYVQHCATRAERVSNLLINRWCMCMFEAVVQQRNSVTPLCLVRTILENN